MSNDETRVGTKRFGALPRDSPLLVEAPTADGHEPQRLHGLAADGPRRGSEPDEEHFQVEATLTRGE
jgi:hypothetical protein